MVLLYDGVDFTWKLRVARMSFAFAAVGSGLVLHAGADYNGNYKKKVVKLHRNEEAYLPSGMTGRSVRSIW